LFNYSFIKAIVAVEGRREKRKEEGRREEGKKFKYCYFYHDPPSISSLIHLVSKPSPEIPHGRQAGFGKQ
jgi:hypothetical protein